MKNKGILILGSIGSGKSHFEEELCRWTDFQESRMFNRIDPDNLVENENSEFYKNPLKASNYIYKTVIPNIMELPMDFVLQSTGANPKTIQKIIDYPNYQFKIVVVYCNPIIAFIRNFSRERKCPKQIVLENWFKVYSNIEEYTNMVGKDNIYVYETEYTEKEEGLIYENNFFSNIYDTIKYLETKNEYTSSFKKQETLYTPQEEEIKNNKFEIILENISKKHSLIYSNIEDLFKDNIKDEISRWILE